MNKHRGFTLLELSIVLVIIALIMSVVFIGKHMVANANVQTLVSERDFYEKAIHEFIDKYQAIPGDMNNAQDYWGANDAGICDGSVYATTAGRESCNGNGNGMIGEGATPVDTVERLGTWQHLANAGMIKGSYPGAPFGVAQTGLGLEPKSSIPDATWSISYNAAAGSHLLSNSGLTNKAFTTSHLIALDEKIDDGDQNTGNFRDIGFLVSF